MSDVNPTLNWYTHVSKTLGLTPRCPFGSANLCPRYYMSLALMKQAGATEIGVEEHTRLLRKWKESPLWPSILEQEPIVVMAGEKHGFSSLSNFCPEVTFDRFGYFASFLKQQEDEIDQDAIHETLTSEAAPREDWRWHWASLSSMHYSECPTYSPLAHGHGLLTKPTPSENQNRFDRFIDKAKRHRLIGIFLVVGLIVIAAGNFTDALFQLWQIFRSIILYFVG
jgi:hypothetical protein